MKSKLILFSFVLFSTVCYSQSDSTIQYDTLFKEGYEIKCPKSWETLSQKIGVFDFLMIEPSENSKNNYRANVSVLVGDFKGEKVDLEKYKANNEDELKSHLHDFVLIESVIRKDSNISYYKYAYTFRKGKRHVRMFARSFIKSGKLYLASFTGETETYDSYKKIAEEIINSFRPL